MMEAVHDNNGDTMPVITLKDSLSLAVLRGALEREKRVLMLSIAEVEAKLATFQAKFGVPEPQALFGQVDDLALIEWAGEQETLARLHSRLQRLEEIQVEPN